MKSILITNIPDETHRYLRIHCLRRGVSLMYLLREAIKKVAEHEKNREQGPYPTAISPETTTDSGA